MIYQKLVIIMRVNLTTLLKSMQRCCAQSQDPKGGVKKKKYILGKFPIVRRWYQGNGEVAACLYKQLLFYGIGSAGLSCGWEREHYSRLSLDN